MTALAEPFSTPGLFVLDTLRGLLALAGLVLAGYQVKMVRESVTAGQRAGFLGIAGALLILALSRLENLGGPLTWQAVAAAVVMGLFGYRTWSFLHREDPAGHRQVDPPPGRHGAR